MTMHVIFGVANGHGTGSGHASVKFYKVLKTAKSLKF